MSKKIVVNACYSITEPNREIKSQKRLCPYVHITWGDIVQWECRYAQNERILHGESIPDWCPLSGNNEIPDDYDPGLLSDFGGGNVEWWQDYLRSEIDRCNKHWREAVEELIGESNE